MHGHRNPDASGADELTVRGDETIGRQRGNETFVKAIEKKTGRDLRPGKRGPKPGTKRRSN